MSLPKLPARARATTHNLDAIRKDVRRLLALLALEQLDPCDAIDWAQSVAAHFQDSHGLRVLAGYARTSAGAWLHHAAQDLGVASPTRGESAKILASDSGLVAPGK